MNISIWAKKIYYGFWHLFIWFLLNICVGSLPFIQTLFRKGKDDPFQIGLLCFCFTIVSSGLYISLVDSIQREHSGHTRVKNFVLIGLAFFWAIFVWTVVLKLPDITSLIGDQQVVRNGLVFLYVVSIIMFLLSNRRSLSEAINAHLSKTIPDAVENSKTEGGNWSSRIDSEEGV